MSYEVQLLRIYGVSEMLQIRDSGSLRLLICARSCLSYSGCYSNHMPRQPNRFRGDSYAKVACPFAHSARYI